jgi:adenylate cyclase
MWLFQRYLEHEALRSVTERMEEAVTGAEPRLRRQGDPAVAFIDLAGFTVLSAEAGDAGAAELAGRFTDLLLETTQAHRGRVVKTMGDGAMLFFDDGGRAVTACLELERALDAAGLPPMRAGINRGPVVAQSGDYYGNTINVAARITDYARPREVLVSAEVLPGGSDGIELEEIGEVTLKGVAQPVRLSRARRTS